MRNEIVLDLETKSAPGAFGGRDLKGLGISVVGTWSSATDTFKCYREHEFIELATLLKGADRLIGFFINKFDIPVLEPHVPFDLHDIPVLDIFDDVTSKLGHRVSLASLAKGTLKAGKLGHGLDAVEWYKNGEWEKLEEYCTQDVRLTRDLYFYGRDHGHLLFESYIDAKTVSVPVSWGMPDEFEIRNVIEQARNLHHVLEIDYVSRENAGDGFRKIRKVEIQNMKGDEIEAYDHLRGDVRTFRISRIFGARVLDEVVKERLVPQTLFS